MSWWNFGSEKQLIGSEHYIDNQFAFRYSKWKEVFKKSDLNYVISHSLTAKNVAELIVEEALRFDFKVDSNINWEPSFKLALFEARKYGFGLCVVGKKDGNSIDFESNESVLFIPNKYLQYTFDVFGEVSEIKLAGSKFDNFQKIIPLSKSIVFGGSDNFSISVFEIFPTSIAYLEMGYEILGDMMTRSSFAHIGIKDMSEAMKDPGGVDNELRNINEGYSLYNSVVTDSETKIEFKKLDLQGVHGSVEKYQVKISSDYKIPFAKLFPESPAGLNTTGEGDRNNWVDQINSFRKLVILPALKKLLKFYGQSLPKLNFTLDEEKSNKEISNE